MPIFTLRGGTSNPAYNFAPSNDYLFALLGAIDTDYLQDEGYLYTPVAGTLTHLNVFVYNLDIPSVSHAYAYISGTGQGNLDCVLPAATTGRFSDDSNSDSLSADDKFSINVNVGSGGTFMELGSIDVLFTSSDYKHPIGSFYTDVVHSTTARYTGIVGNANYNIEMPYYHLYDECSWVNGSIYVNSNAKDAATLFESWINQATGNVSISVPSTSTGLFEDTATDTISDDDVCWRVSSAGTGLIYFTRACCGLDALFTPLISSYAGASQSNATRYYSIVGELNASASSLIARNYALGVSNFYDLSINVQSNSLDATSTATFWKNGATTSLTANIPSTSTGIFEDLTHSVSVAEDDYFCYQVNASASTTGTMAIWWLSVLESNIINAIDADLSSSSDSVAVSDSVVGALTMLKALADIVGVSDWFDNGFIDPPLTADVVEKLWSYADL